MKKNKDMMQYSKNRKYSKGRRIPSDQKLESDKVKLRIEVIGEITGSSVCNILIFGC